MSTKAIDDINSFMFIRRLPKKIKQKKETLELKSLKSQIGGPYLNKPEVNDDDIEKIRKKIRHHRNTIIKAYECYQRNRVTSYNTANLINKSYQLKRVPTFLYSINDLAEGNKSSEGNISIGSFSNKSPRSILNSEGSKNSRRNSKNSNTEFKSSRNSRKSSYRGDTIKNSDHGSNNEEIENYNNNDNDNNNNSNNDNNDNNNNSNSNKQKSENENTEKKVELYDMYGYKFITTSSRKTYEPSSFESLNTDGSNKLSGIDKDEINSNSNSLSNPNQNSNSDENYIDDSAVTETSDYYCKDKRKLEKQSKYLQKTRDELLKEYVMLVQKYKKNHDKPIEEPLPGYSNSNLSLSGIKTNFNKLVHIPKNLLDNNNSSNDNNNNNNNNTKNSNNYTRNNNNNNNNTINKDKNDNDRNIRKIKYKINNTNNNDNNNNENVGNDENDIVNNDNQKRNSNYFKKRKNELLSLLSLGTMESENSIYLNQLRYPPTRKKITLQSNKSSSSNLSSYSSASSIKLIKLDKNQIRSLSQIPDSTLDKKLVPLCTETLIARELPVIESKFPISRLFWMKNVASNY